MLSAVLAIVNLSDRLTVWPSVCHTLVSSQNDL